MILPSNPTLIYSIIIITKVINGYIILTANLGDFKIIAKRIIAENVAEILGRIISISNGKSQTKYASDEEYYESEEYLKDDRFEPINLRRSDRTANIEIEENYDDEIVQEANKYVIEQLGKHIKERVIEDLVSKFLRVKFKTDRKENVQRGEMRNTVQNPQYHYKEKTVIRHYKNGENMKKTVEISKENQQLHIKRYTVNKFAKKFNNDANDSLLKRKVPKENNPTPNGNNEFKRPHDLKKKTIKNKQVKGNEIFVILEPKMDSTEKNINDGTSIHHDQKIKDTNKIERVKHIASTATTRKNRFIKKNRRERISPKDTKEKEKKSPKKSNNPSDNTQPDDVIYERIKLNTNYSNSNEYSSNLEKDEKEFKDQENPKPISNTVKRIEIKKKRDDAKKVKDISKETDVIKAVTRYLWIDDEIDETEQEKTMVSDEMGSSQEYTTPLPKKSKKIRFITTPHNYGSLPTSAERYDFNEPLPERDRVREVIKPIRKPPSRINKKQKAI